MHHDSKRGIGFYLLAAFFALFVVFLYGPMVAVITLSFQGPDGGLTLVQSRRQRHGSDAGRGMI